MLEPGTAISGSARSCRFLRFRHLSQLQLMLVHVAALKSLPHIIIVHIIFSGPFGSLDSFLVILKIEYCLAGARGRGQCCTFHY